MNCKTISEISLKNSAQIKDLFYVQNVKNSGGEIMGRNNERNDSLKFKKKHTVAF